VRDGARCERRNGWIGRWVDGRVRVYEAHEVKKKIEKLRCLCLRRNKIFCFFTFMM
jgi:hypothetical protein